MGFRPGFAVGLCANNPCGPEEGESWDLSKASDLKELFEMIAFERPVIVTGSPLVQRFLNFKIGVGTQKGRSGKQ